MALRCKLLGSDSENVSNLVSNLWGSVSQVNFAQVNIYRTEIKCPIRQYKLKNKEILPVNYNVA